MTVIINLPGLPVQRLDSVSTIALLRAIPSASLTDGQDIAVDGTAAVGDGGGGLFVWSELSVENDDGATIIRPDTVPPLSAGRWVLTSAGAILNSFSSEDGAGLVGFDNDATYPADTVGSDLQIRAYRDLNNVTTVNSQYTQDSSFTPVGNGALTRGWWNVKLFDQHDDEREFLTCWGADFRHGGGGDPTYQWDKVLQYKGVTVGATVRQAWVMNDLLKINADAANVRYINGYELDIDPYSGSFGTGNGASGIGLPSVHGMTINGSSDPDGYSITSGICLISSTPGGVPLYERGFMVGLNAVRQAAFDDYSNAAASFRDLGSHSVGIDLSNGVYSAGPIYIPNDKSILAKTAGGAPSAMMRVDSTDNLVLGDQSNHTNVVVARTVIPSVDNLWQLGVTSFRFSSVWAVNGSIQTSDATLKTNIQEVDAEKAMFVLDALTPKSWKWVVGGQRAVTGTEMQEVQTGTEPQTIKVLKRVGTKIVDGVEVPVREEVEEEIQVPVTEMMPVEVVTGYEDVPGQRIHYGFLAGDVKAAIDDAGFDDFGGYVLGEDGTEALRPDQLIPILWMAVKSLSARVAQLEAV